MSSEILENFVYKWEVTEDEEEKANKEYELHREEKERDFKNMMERFDQDVIIVEEEVKKDESKLVT